MLNFGLPPRACVNCNLLGYNAARSDCFLPTFRDKLRFKNQKYFGFLTHEGGTMGYAETSIRNYHYSLRDNSEQKISHHVWVFSKPKAFVTIFLKIGQTIRQLKHKH